MGTRKAGQWLDGHHHNHSPFNPEVDGTFSLNQTGADVMEILSGASGSSSSINPVTPGEGSLYGTGGGSVMWDKPSELNVDPHASAHTLAHEGAHSQFPTALSEEYKRRILASAEGSPYAGREWNPTNLPRNGASIRYMYETEAVPTMLEEANAQGIARAVTDKMGLGNIEGRDNLSYPMIYGYKFLDQLDNNTPTLDGIPLGVGITGTDSEREEYYRIVDNMRTRVQRQFNHGYNLIPQ